MSAKIAMIAAVAENGVIGADQDIPWRIPSDFAHFKRTTMGKPIVMGRKQYESVGRLLPGRTNIIITRQPGYAVDGAIVMSTLEAAIERARSIAEADGINEVMIIGGGEIYRQAMPWAQKLYISHVDLAPEGAITFPPIDPAEWVVVDTPEVNPSEKDPASFRIKVYERR